jgi:hypothetical protein
MENECYAESIKGLGILLAVLGGVGAIWLNISPFTPCAFILALCLPISLFPISVFLINRGKSEQNKQQRNQFNG